MGSSELFLSPGSLPESPPAKNPRFSSDTCGAASGAAILAVTEQEKQVPAATPAPDVVGPEQGAEANDEAWSTDAAAAVETVMAADVLAVKPMAEEAEQADEPEPKAKAPLEAATSEEEQPASAALVSEQEPQAKAFLEAATGEEELAADEAEKADDTAATAPVPEQESETTKASPEAAGGDVTEKQEPKDKTAPEAATSEEEKAKLAPLLAICCSDHGRSTQQETEASSPAGKSSGENGVVEKAASPAPKKARPRLTAEVRMSKGVHVDIRFRCRCGGACRDVAIS